MEIDFVKKNEIVAYAKKAPGIFVTDIPISPPRAVSQAANPDALDEDVLLIVAREDRKLLSFIGLYPGIVKNEPGQRIFWISCWWKAEGVPSEISRKVLQAFLDYCGREVGVPHLPPHIINVLEKNQISIKERNGFMLRFRSAIHERSLQRSLKGNANRLVCLMRQTGLFRMTDFMINTINPVRRKTNDLKINPDFQVFHELPDGDYFSFIHSRFKNYLSLPHKKNIEWILGSSWLVSPESADMEVLKRYHFSYIAESFYHFFPVLRKKGNIVAAGFFSSRDGVVKSLYIFIEKGFEEEYFNYLLKLLEDDKSIHTLISYERVFVEYLEKTERNRRNITFVKRYTGIGNKNYISLEPTDADGDSCFT